MESEALPAWDAPDRWSSRSYQLSRLGHNLAAARGRSYISSSQNLIYAQLRWSADRHDNAAVIPAGRGSSADGPNDARLEASGISVN